MSWFVSTISRESAEVPKKMVETGTYRGDGVRSYIGYFDEIYSIELNEEFYKSAVEQFSDNSSVKIIYGDSGNVLQQMNFGSNPVLFYLDAHFCGGVSSGGCGRNSAIFKEIEAIIARNVKGDVIIIDDTRLMGKSQWEGTDGTAWPRCFLDWSDTCLQDLKDLFSNAKLVKECTDCDRLLVII
jgi:hypothetical protein